MEDKEQKLTDSVSKIFKEFSEFTEANQLVRDQIKMKVRDLEHSVRETVAILARIHHQNGLRMMETILEAVDKQFEWYIIPRIAALSSVVPKGQYYRFHNLFNYSLQRLSYIVTLVHYLKRDKLLHQQGTAARLNMTCQENEKDDRLYLDLDDYLLGVIMLGNELSRLVVNLVTNHEFSLPMRISDFLAEILQGFRLLNLKNDTLRKRFDSMKYDMKKVEDVRYDLSIRGLAKPIDDVDDDDCDKKGDDGQQK